MKKIKNILVPTDFSVSAGNAFRYAKHLAEVLGATVTVVHVNESILPTSELAITPIADLEINLLTQESMEMFVAEDNTSDDGDVQVMVKNKVKTQTFRGDLVDTLVGLSSAKDASLMVIGTTGLEDFMSKIIGSTSLELANKAHCPVILVPRDAKWQKINKIMYASNYESITPGLIEYVSDFAQFLDATIHFVHISNVNEELEDEGVDVQWNEIFPASNQIEDFEVHSIDGDNKLDELKNYAKKHKINMMAFVSKHRNFWDHLMHRSVTENMALSTDIPMMVMHLDDNR